MKIISTMIGLILNCLPSCILRSLLGGSDFGTQRGIHVSNINESEMNASTVGFNASLLRFNYVKGSMLDVAQYVENAGVQYFVQIGRPEQNANEIARDIISCVAEISGHRKPMYFAVINESNEYTYANLTEVIELLLSRGYDNDVVPVIRGPHTAISESAGTEVYTSYALRRRDFAITKYHDIHYYEVFSKKLTSKFSNLFLKARLVYGLLCLRLVGQPASSVIISESHDGEREWGGVTHGDYVFATAKGWAGIEKTCTKLGVYGVCYYASPFLKYKDNEMLGKN